MLMDQNIFIQMEDLEDINAYLMSIIGNTK